MSLNWGSLKEIAFKVAGIFWFEILLCFFLLIFYVEAEAGNMYSVKNQSSEFYLIGSSHKPIPDFEELPKEWIEILKNASTICFESLNQDPNKTMLEYEKIATGNRKIQSRKILSRGIYNQSHEILTEKFNLPEKLVDRLSTYSPYFFADAFASFIPVPSVAGKSVDGLLQEKAKELGIGSDCYVETVKASLTPGAQITLREAENYLKYAMKLIVDEKELERLFQHDQLVNKYYSNGDLEAICKIEIDYHKKNQLFPILQKTIFNRNIAQLKTIKTLTSEKDNLVFAVGALHLCGKNGLVNKFRNSGYVVTDVNEK